VRLPIRGETAQVRQSQYKEKLKEYLFPHAVEERGEKWLCAGTTVSFSKTTDEKVWIGKRTKSSRVIK